MITDEQREQRKLGIGGSDMPIILGLSRYKTPYQLYLEKKGIISTSDKMSPLQYWGNRLEPIIRDEFSDRNKVFIQTPDTIIHPFYDFMRANVDGYISEWDAVLEVKCSTQYMAHEWGESESDNIPMAYLVQVAHYCSVLNASCAYIAVLIGGYDYRQYKYIRDFQLEKIIIDSASDFWNAVQNDNVPLPSNQIDLKMMFPCHKKDKHISISDDILCHLNKINEVKVKIKELKALEEESRFNLMKHMKDAECLTDEEGNPLITWKTNKKGSRTFLLKGEK
ncbi:MAG TPA: YqaJ viral recombinase family protein [Waddliaceae bacterium]